VAFPQPGAVEGIVPPYWVEKGIPGGPAAGRVVFEKNPSYKIRVANIPCAINSVREEKVLPVRKGDQ
jgi:hypothetical protein